MSNSQMHDSGERRTFETGAVRDMARDKSRPDLISPFATDRLGRWLALGAQKYTERNWEKGLPIGQCIASLERHLVAYKAGKVEEDHLAAVMCNAMFIAHYEHEIEAGRLPASLDDLPRYELRFDALLKVEKPQAGFCMTATHCMQTPGPYAAPQQAAQAEQLTANVNKDIEVLGDQTNSGWTDDQLDKLVDVLYDIFGFQEHMAITPDIAARIAEAVDEINWQYEDKPTWKQYTGECTVDLKRLQDAWRKMKFIAPGPDAPMMTAEGILVPFAEWAASLRKGWTTTAETARLQRRDEMCRAIAKVTTESFRNLGVDRAFPDTDYSILALFTPKMWASHELDTLLDKANALDDNPDRAQHELFLTSQRIAEANARSATPWMDKHCLYMTDRELVAAAKELNTCIAGFTDEERIAAAQDEDAVPVEDLGFSIVPPDHPKTHGIPYWVQPPVKPRRRSRAYLAGPMRGYKMFNWPAFKLATKLWTIRGYDILSPADADDEEDGLYPMTDPEGAEAQVATYGPEMIDKIIRRDVEAIMGLDSEEGDCLILLPGWERSTGARAEQALARWRGLTCYDALEGQIVEDEA